MLGKITNTIKKTILGSILGNEETPALNPAELILWYDSSNPTSIVADGNNLTQFIDLSGKNNDSEIQSNPTYQPTTGLSTINGLNVVDFTISEIILPTTTALGIKGNPYEILIVAKNETNAEPAFVLASDAGEKYEIHFGGDVGARYIPNGYDGGQGASDIGSLNQYLDVTIVLGVRTQNNKGIISVNNIESTDLADHPISSSDLRLGIGNRTNSPPNFPYGGKLAEIRIFKNILTPLQRENLVNELSIKWGIPIVPSKFLLENDSGFILLEDGSYLLTENN